ncbi:AraC family transcriptional regulator [Nonomuraea terrae]|uniref:AraC family transcriptional regulator n=1 Tax=Nonomuraea terrae TaxID=2530383 RepID=UPI003CCC6245
MAFVAQGAKRSVPGERSPDYHAGQYVSVDLPLTSQVIRASPGEPFQAFGMALERAAGRHGPADRLGRQPREPRRPPSDGFGRATTG